MSDQTAHALQPESTHAVDIFAFVEAQEIPSAYFETLYLLAPAPGDEHAYAALRETLRSTRKIGIACVVLHARPHIVALLPQGESLVINTLRYAVQADRSGVRGDAERLHCLLANAASIAEAAPQSMRSSSGTPWPANSERWQAQAGRPRSDLYSSLDCDQQRESDSDDGDIEECAGLDEAFEDECLASILRHSRHPRPVKAASRSAQVPRCTARHSSGGRRSRMHQP